jgi:hypothetical protein
MMVAALPMRSSLLAHVAGRNSIALRETNSLTSVRLGHGRTIAQRLANLSFHTRHHAAT